MAPTSALAGLRVLDLSNQRTGAQASQTLADFGAEVIHVEPPGGSALRAEAAWPMWGRGKRAIQLDLKAPADLDTARALAGRADVVIETFRPGVAERLGLSYDALSQTNPGLIWASITGFGRTGPLAGLQGYEGVVAAKTGTFWALETLCARPGPKFCTVSYAGYPASQLAVQGVLAALYERQASGLGQRVDASLVQGLTVSDTFQWFNLIAQRQSSDVPGPVMPGVSRLLLSMTRDGKWLQFSQMPDRLFDAMMRMFGFPDWRTMPEYLEPELRQGLVDRMHAIVHSKTAAEWAAEFDRDPNVWAERFHQGSELLDHPQMVWNRMVAATDDRDLGPLRAPGPIVRMDATPADTGRPAPRLGEHDAAIRAEAAQAAPPAATPPAAGGRRPPLEGVTIVELGTYYAAPYSAALLADLGARVIKLEQPEGDTQRNMLPIPEVAGLKSLQGKECVGVDLGTQRGREIAYRILAKADLVLQSFRAGAAERLGLDAASLKAVNPALIYQASPGYGEDGPCGHRPAFAPTIGAGAGMAWRQAGALIPHDVELDVPQIKLAGAQLGAANAGVGNADGLAAVTAASGLLLGLVARARGAGGQHQLTTMLSSVGHAISEVMVEYENRPEAPTADLGLHGFNALYRLYEAAEEWVFLAAPTQREWERFAAALPAPDGPRLAADARFAAPDARRANDEALVLELAAIFRARPAAEWERLMRAADVACVMAERGPVVDNYLNPDHIGGACDLICGSHHPVFGDIPRLKPLVRFSRSATVAGNAGLVGQHTAAVLAEFGYGEAEIAGLAADGVVVVRAPYPSPRQES